MVLILSETNDNSVAKVLEWLTSKDSMYIVINCDVPVELISLTLHRFVIRTEGRIVDSDNVVACWFRRGPIKLKIDMPILPVEMNNSAQLETQQSPDIFSYVKREANCIINYIYDILENKRKIGSIRASHFNKLKGLFIAKSVGFHVPGTIVCDSYSKILSFYENKTDMVTKPLSEIYVGFEDGVLQMGYTRKLDSSDREVPTFFPSLVQELIVKAYEVRIFILNDKLFPMAIFSQANEQTKIDYRNYSIEKPNRNVPYNLPGDIVELVYEFMRFANLDTGSIDLIKSETGEYYFLEVNPQGNFAGLSAKCNYHIERHIAEFLTGNI